MTFHSILDHRAVRQPTAGSANPCDSMLASAPPLAPRSVAQSFLHHLCSRARPAAPSTAKISSSTTCRWPPRYSYLAAGSSQRLLEALDWPEDSTSKHASTSVRP